MPGAEHPPPPPPARRFRRPFLTAFVADVFPFLPAADLLVCAGVSRIWREEANSLSLWRALLSKDPKTAMHAGRPLALRAIQKMLLRRNSLLATKENSAEHSSLPNGRNFVHYGQNTPKSEVRVFTQNEFTNEVAVGRFSSGILFSRMTHNVSGASNHETIAYYSPMRSSVDSTMKAIEFLQSHTILLREQISSSAQLIIILHDQMPSKSAFSLHWECCMQWKRVKIFEELVVNSLCSSIEALPFTGGIRSFVHAEILGLGNVGSQFHLQWCRFKRLLLTDDYYDYVDFLYSYGPGKVRPLRLSKVEEAEGIRKIQYFSMLRDMIGDIIRRVNGESKNISWNSLLQCLQRE